MTASDEARAGHAIVFAAARLIDGTGAPPRENTAIVVRDGALSYVGPAEECPRPDDGAVTIDLGGRTVTPGFFDCHVHFLMDSNADFTGRLLTNRPTVTIFERANRMRDTLYAGVTSARDLGGIDAGYRDAAQLGLIDAPRLHVALRLMSHTGGHADFRLPSGFDPCAVLEPFNELVDTVDEARLATRRLLRDGADVIKVCATGGVNSPSDQPEDEGLSIEEIAAVVEEVQRHRGRPVAAHAQGARGIVNALRGGVTSIEHGYLIDDEGIDLMLEKQAFLVPTLATFTGRARHLTADAAEKKRRLADVAMQRLGTAVERGVKVAMGTDSGVAGHGRNLEELALMTGIGLSPLQAIAAGTRTAAQLLGVDDRLGTVETGKLADLVVCAVDPLSDIGSLADPANVLMVVQNGRIVKDLSGLRSLRS